MSTYMRACLDEMTASVSGITEIQIGRKQTTDADGYIDGRYYGVGEPIYRVTAIGTARDPYGALCDTEDDFDVRAPDRATLRAALAVRFPGARVGQ